MNSTSTERIRVRHGEVAFGVAGAGPPLILVHGTPSYSHLWRDVIPVLARTHQVYFFDLLSYGRSTLAADREPSVALHAETLAELVGRWRLDTPAFAGHDIGGAAVLRAHLLHRVPASAIALLDAAVLAPWLTPAAAHMRRNAEVYRSMPTHIFARIIGGHLATATHTPMPEGTAAAYLDHFAGPEGQQRWLDQISGFREEDTEPVVERLGHVSVPTQVIWGEQDQWLPVDTARRLADAIPGAGTTLVQGAGHFLTEDKPEAVARALTQFLANNSS